MHFSTCSIIEHETVSLLFLRVGISTGTYDRTECWEKSFPLFLFILDISKQLDDPVKTLARRNDSWRQNALKKKVDMALQDHHQWRAFRIPQTYSMFH